jgi:hypothetical protein
MTDRDPDLDLLDLDDLALASMAHDSLVALLNRLYTRLGEKQIAPSAAFASTDDELRASIRAAVRRIAAKRGAPLQRASHGRDSAAEAERRSDRVFVVLVADDRALVADARTACRARGVALVAVSSRERLIDLVANVTPSHVVVDTRTATLDDACLRDLRARGTRVCGCQGSAQTLHTLAEMDSAEVMRRTPRSEKRVSGGKHRGRCGGR